MAGGSSVGSRLALGFVLAVGLVSVVGCKKKEPVAAVESDAPVVVAPLPTVPPIAPMAAPATGATTPDVPAGSASASARSRSPGSTSLLEKATEAAAEGRSADVRRLLEAKVRSGHGSVEEMRLVRKACSSPPDKACLADIKAKYH